MTKRKHVVCIDPKKKALPKKVQTKAELVQEVASLKALNDALEDENKSTGRQLQNWKRKVKKL